MFTKVGCVFLPAAMLSTKSGADSGKKARKKERKKERITRSLRRFLRLSCTNLCVIPTVLTLTRPGSQLLFDVLHATSDFSPIICSETGEKDPRVAKYLPQSCSFTGQSGRPDRGTQETEMTAALCLAFLFSSPLILLFLPPCFQSLYFLSSLLSFTS